MQSSGMLSAYQSFILLTEELKSMFAWCDLTASTTLNILDDFPPTLSQKRTLIHSQITPTILVQYQDILAHKI